MTAELMNTSIGWLEWTGLHMSPWKIIGLIGALMFAGRWMVQFLASRRQGKPVIPRAFWYMSLIGSAMALSYFLFSAKQDAVGVVQTCFQRSPPRTAYGWISGTAAGTGPAPAIS